MSSRHQASRRRAYGRRHHEVRERTRDSRLDLAAAFEPAFLPAHEPAFDAGFELAFDTETLVELTDLALRGARHELDRRPIDSWLDSIR